MKRKTHWAGLALAMALAALALLIGVNRRVGQREIGRLRVRQLPVCDAGRRPPGHLHRIRTRQPADDESTRALLLQRPENRHQPPAGGRDRQPARRLRMQNRPAGAVRMPGGLPGRNRRLETLRLRRLSALPSHSLQEPGGGVRLPSALRGGGAAVPGVQREDRKRLRARRRIDRHLAPAATPVHRTDLLGRARGPLLRPAAVQTGRKGRLLLRSQPVQSIGRTRRGPLELAVSLRPGRARRPLLAADRADEPEPDDLRRAARIDDRRLLVRPRVDARARPIGRRRPDATP